MNDIYRPYEQYILVSSKKSFMHFMCACVCVRARARYQLFEIIN